MEFVNWFANYMKGVEENLDDGQQLITTIFMPGSSVSLRVSQVAMNIDKEIILFFGFDGQGRKIDVGLPISQLHYTVTVEDASEKPIRFGFGN